MEMLNNIIKDVDIIFALKIILTKYYSCNLIYHILIMIKLYNLTV